MALVLRVLDLGATIAMVGVGAFALRQRTMPLFAVAIVLPLLRLMVQAATIGDGDIFSTLAPLITDTRYGQVMLARAVIVALWCGALSLRAPRPIGIGFAILDIAALALLGHGAASDRPIVGAIVLAVHIGAACLWIGGMAVVLVGVVRHTSVAALRGFAPLGLACVAALTITGLLNLQIVTGDILGAFAGGYGAILIGKLICFAAMLGLAAVNRFALLPNLDRQGSAAHRAMLALAAETVLGGVVIALAALLASGPSV